MISTLLACLCGLLTIAQPLDQGYWNTRFRFAQKPAPKSIVLVRTDTKSEGSDAETARLIETLAQQQPRHIYFDRKISDPSPDLVRALNSLGDRLSVVVRFANPDTIEETDIELPASNVIPKSRIVVSGWFTNFWGYGAATVYAARINGRVYPSLSAAISGRTGTVGEAFRPDYAVDPQT
ncbi:MAG: CHASE2 domain-containing protein, partial [Sphingomonadales bacterium]|nr:CHASE2 domain-containing protein [Sphingomonadales bacterium]